MKAILIDSELEIITEIETDATYEEIHQLLDCENIDVIPINPIKHHMYVNIEAWSTLFEDKSKGFNFNFHRYIHKIDESFVINIIGLKRAVIFSDGIYGTEGPCKIPVKEIELYTSFLSHNEIYPYHIFVNKNKKIKKMNLNEKVIGFRKPDHNYFNWVFSRSTFTIQPSPFMLMKNGKITWIDRFSDLQRIAEKEDIILQTWPGQRRSDVFAYTFDEINKEYEKIIEKL
ncbi:MAG: hypothetical protein WC319_10095 [Candidatus Paceibacterota bacterium]|jgi:hypothetical protein